MSQLHEGNASFCETGKQACFLPPPGFFKALFKQTPPSMNVSVSLLQLLGDEGSQCPGKAQSLCSCSFGESDVIPEASPV